MVLLINMGVTIREISIGSDERSEILYYGFNNTSDSPQTKLTPHLSFVIGYLVGSEPSVSREDLEDVAANLKPQVEITPEGTAQLHEALSTLQGGEDIPVEQKQALHNFEKFMDAVIDSHQVRYDELESDMMVNLLKDNGLDQDAWDYVSEDDGLMTYFGDRITYPVYANDAIAADYGQEPFFMEEFDNMEGRRKVASMVLLLKTKLAVGALFAAGTQGDKVALGVSEGLDSLLRI